MYRKIAYVWKKERRNHPVPTMFVNLVIEICGTKYLKEKRGKIRRCKIWIFWGPRLLTRGKYLSRTKIAKCEGNYMFSFDKLRPFLFEKIFLIINK